MARKRLLIGGAVLLLAIAAPIAWYLISPLFINKTVNDDFPAVAAAPAQSPLGTAISAPSAAPTTTPQPPTPTTPPPTATPLPAQGAPSTARPTTAATASPTSPTPTSTALPPTALPPTAAPTGPVALRSGQFHDVVHEGSGVATIYRLPDGKLVLRLENLDVLNGPDLYLYLSVLPDSTDSPPVLANKYLSLGRLKGNKGNQTYDLPADFDPQAFHSVTVWCQQFRVNFATAPLK